MTSTSSRRLLSRDLAGPRTTPGGGGVDGGGGGGGTKSLVISRLCIFARSPGRTGPRGAKASPAASPPNPALAFAALANGYPPTRSSSRSSSARAEPRPPSPENQRASDSPRREPEPEPEPGPPAFAPRRGGGASWKYPRSS